MKRFAVFLLSLAVLVWIAAPASAQSKQNSLMSFRWVSHLTPPEMPESKAAPAFEKLKSLVGEWQGKDAKGGTINVSYQLISNGSSLMETLMPAKEPSMVTIYHLDGDNLIMTHYCSMANQPRMRAAAAMGDVKKLDFSFVDATNMASPADAHMSNLVFTFQDKDHFSQEWTMTHGDQKMPVVFTLERKK
jgi:hypothetical protein